MLNHKCDQPSPPPPPEIQNDLWKAFCVYAVDQLDQMPDMTKLRWCISFEMFKWGFIHGSKMASGVIQKLREENSTKN